MKSHFAGVLAVTLASTQILAAPALAREPATQFRTVAAQSFSDEDLRRYGLSSEEVAKVQAYQAQGREIVVLTPEQAQQYTAGAIDNDTLLILGGLIIVAIAIAD